ncbi:MAG: hypothetical protein ACO1NX_03305 [Chitinophagaceae bacterium]
MAEVPSLFLLKLLQQRKRKSRGFELRDKKRKMRKRAFLLCAFFFFAPSFSLRLWVKEQKEKQTFLKKAKVKSENHESNGEALKGKRDVMPFTLYPPLGGKLSS